MENAEYGSWAFWVDRGGTFTDIVARAPDGSLVARKLLSQDPERYVDAGVAGIRQVLGIDPGDPVPPGVVDVVKLGTTIATNALLEGTGAPTALVVTEGFGDGLRIAYQHRPRIFDPAIVLPAMVYGRVIEVAERVSVAGEVLRPLDLERARRDLQRAHDDGFRAVAIVCLHGYRFPGHEVELAEVARAIGYTQISPSHQVDPLMKFVVRGDTTVVDAHLSPLLGDYLGGLVDELGGARLMLMQSNGGLADAQRFRGKDSVLSGPAGGIVGMMRVSQALGFDKAIGFDMGGTSTDVSHHAGELERVMETEVAGVRVRSPMLAIHTVAAGGGSVLRFDGSRLRVGPDSAGADPGPACYGRSGPLTVTDANLMLGRIQATWFPHVFGPGGDRSLDVEVTRRGFAELAAQVGEATGDAVQPEEAAMGFLEIAVENMANAIKKISVQRGHDVTEYVLVTFGGAGGQHACAVADALGMTRVVIPAYAGVLSAYGIGLADTVSMKEEAIDRVLAEDLLGHLEAAVGRLEGETRAELVGEGVAARGTRVVRRVHLRYQGTDTSLPVGYASMEEMRRDFEDAHRRQYSFTMPGRDVIAEAVSVEAIGVADQPDLPKLFTRPGRLQPQATVPVHVGGAWRHVGLYRREELCAADIISGPALVTEDHATTLVEPGWELAVTPVGHLVLTRVAAAGEATVTAEVDPVKLEVFNNLFMAIAEQMGTRLESTARSVNIKERLDFSCALFGPDGALVANAPHIPVHLGSMGDSIKQVIAANGDRMRPGHVYALNDPYHGGTHLPDITVVTPVFDDEGTAVLFYVASRGHHAEIGGLSPGSMPAFSRSIVEEGVLFDNWLLVEDGRFREEETREVLAGAAYPSRSPEDNLADLRAQVAANEKGVQEVRAMAAHFGLEVVHAYMRHVQDNAEESVRRVISVLHDGHYRYEMDSGAVIEVSVAVDREGRSAVIDFTGTSAELETNFNAPSSVARAAILYVFRTLVSDDIPLNEGCMKPLSVRIPEGSMLAPRFPAGTVAGNVETSQAVTGALYAALGVMAEGSGTMNNVTFGNERYQYYETVGSGSGAGPGFNGADVVQTHMTNSRLTDPEVLESRFPVLLESFSVRRGTGGAGRWHGGDGGRRRIRFLEPMSVALLSGHRRVPPYGMAGGQPGSCGRNALHRADGSTTELQGVDATDVAVGDVLVVETPGGGGFGEGERGDGADGRTVEE
ncbi:MAG TPA: hydantoinase B/oxoprolinase family protein [Acidimicrobiales bacterium]|nr:hydantoinase B/oxoprolinase family protein [Acidimicrobiales bacterium]